MPISRPKSLRWCAPCCLTRRASSEKAFRARRSEQERPLRWPAGPLPLQALKRSITDMRPDWNASGQFRVAASDFRIQTASGAAQRFLNVQFAEVDSVPFFRAQKGGAARYGKSDAAPENPALSFLARP